MLVVSRKIGWREKSDIVVETPDGKTIVFSLVETRAGQVRVGVTAPPDFRILRGELTDILDERERVG